LFIVSQDELQNHTREGVEIAIDRARGTKCERCYKYTEDVGSAPEFPTICSTCAAAVNQIREDKGDSGE
jgi:isoleucyl-tRNA synthetase